MIEEEVFCLLNKLILLMDFSDDLVRSMELRIDNYIFIGI